LELFIYIILPAAL